MAFANTVTTMSPFVLANDGNAGNNIKPKHSDWDLITFFKNGTNWGATAGGAFLALIGLVCIIIGGFKIAKKMMNPQQNQQESWVMAIGLLIFGGTLLFGGMSLLLSFARGGMDTVEGFGTGKAK